MTPAELWWLVDANKPPPDYGNLTAAEVAEIYAETYGEP